MYVNKDTLFTHTKHYKVGCVFYSYFSVIHVTPLCGFVLRNRCAWKQADLSCCSWNILPSECKILTHYPLLCSLHKTSHPHLCSQASIGFHTTNPPVAKIFLLRSKHETRAVLPTLQKTPTASQVSSHPSIHAFLTLALIYRLSSASSTPHVASM